MKIKNKEEISLNDGMKDEYEIDYSKSKPNKFAKDFKKSTIKIYDNDKLIKEMKPVLVEIDLIKYFKTSQKINSALRSLVH